MINIILVKHPQSMQDTANPASPRPDDDANGLTPVGRGHATEIGTAIANEFEAVQVYSSPSPRAAEAAAIIAEQLDIEAIADSALSERRIAQGATGVTLQQYRVLQDQTLLAPFDAPPGDESPASHRLRVEAWLAELLSERQSDMSYVIVSHGSVIEHLHSALSWKPVGALKNSFALCEPGHAHLWSALELPDGELVWCLLGTNLWLPGRTPETSAEQRSALARLAITLDSSTRYVNVARQVALQTPEQGRSNGSYYIR